MKVEQFVTSFGEQAELRRLDDGRIVCPICGYIYGAESVSWPARAFAGILECCPCCNVQMGHEDVDRVPPDPMNPIMLRWKELRLQWLEREAWSDEAVSQVERNLGVSVNRPSR